MERERGGNTKYILFALILGAAVGLACVYAPFAVYLAPAFLGFVWAAWGSGAMMAASLTATALTFVFADAASALYILALYIPSSAVIGYVIKARKPWRSAVCISSLLMGVAFYCNLCLPAILAGKEPFADVLSMVSQSADYALSTLSAYSSDGEEAMKNAAQIVAMLEEYAPQLTMYLSCGTAMAFSFADVLIARALCKKQHVELRPMTHFALWQLSKQYNYISLAALAGALLSLLIGLENADAVYAAAACVVLLPLMLGGACYLEFTLRIKKRSAGARAAHYIITALLLPYSLIFMGIMDRGMKVRKHFTIKKGSDKEE